MPFPEPLAAEDLYTVCRPADLELPAGIDGVEAPERFGQARAIESIRFGIGIKRDGYNIFAYGAPGTGKHALVRRHIEKAARAMPVPSDWCYVYNFVESHRPNALELPAGRGNKLSGDMEELVQELRAAIPAAFESEDYQ